jgi:hypothetical protein
VDPDLIEFAGAHGYIEAIVDEVTIDDDTFRLSKQFKAEREIRSLGSPGGLCRRGKPQQQGGAGDGKHPA